MEKGTGVRCARVIASWGLADLMLSRYALLESQATSDSFENVHPVLFISKRVLWWALGGLHFPLALLLYYLRKP
jgi:hypothetical protein